MWRQSSEMHHRFFFIFAYEFELKDVIKSKKKFFKIKRIPIFRQLPIYILWITLFSKKGKVFCKEKKVLKISDVIILFSEEEKKSGNLKIWWEKNPVDLFQVPLLLLFAKPPFL